MCDGQPGVPTGRWGQASDGGRPPWAGDTGLQRLEVFQSPVKHHQDLRQESPFAPCRALAKRTGYVLF